MFEQIDQKFEPFFRFVDERFFGALNNENKGLQGYEYNEESLRVYLLVRENIKNINEEITPDKCLNWPAYSYFKNYLQTDLLNKYLNKLLLDVFCYKDKPTYYSNPFTIESTKRLMRVVEVDNEYYFEHIDALKRYYNILKRNNTNLKDDAAKLVTLIEKETISLEDEIDNKFNLSSRKILTLPAIYFMTHHYHFNWNGIQDKYWDEVKKIVVDGFVNGVYFESANKFRSYACYQLFSEFVRDNNEISEEDKANYFVKIKTTALTHQSRDIRDLFNEMRSMFDDTRKIDIDTFEKLYLPLYSEEFKKIFNLDVSTDDFKKILNSMSSRGGYYTAPFTQMYSKLYRIESPDPNDIIVNNENFFKYLKEGGIIC